MDICRKKNMQQTRRHMRIRHKVKGDAECPRLYVVRTLKHISAQIIDDVSGRTLASATSNCKSFGQNGGNIAAAKLVGQMIAKQAQSKNIVRVVFDRGGRLYHGRVKALADSVRESGIKF